MVRAGFIMTAVLALASCGSADQAAAPAAADGGNTVNAVAEVSGLPEPARNAVFYRAIHDAGLPCQQVVKSEAAAPTDGAPTWQAQCEDGAGHAIVVKPDGTAVVVSGTQP
jgi:hypothetical protein